MNLNCINDFLLQQKLYKEHRKKEIEQHMDQIVAGREKTKKRKLQTLSKAAGDKSGKKTDHMSTVPDDDKKKKKVIDSIEEEAPQIQEEMKKQNYDDDDVAAQKGKEEHEKNGVKEDDDDDDNAQHSESSDENSVDIDGMMTAETDIKHSFVQIFTGICFGLGYLKFMCLICSFKFIFKYFNSKMN